MKFKTKMKRYSNRKDYLFNKHVYYLIQKLLGPLMNIEMKDDCYEITYIKR